ncbi:hypothetical protein BDV93DRAFT_509874 [Ceratobasidium sp. AG-I]|nr:hypothetical protein BDV93DRAFT_509874 [Ceratobasidium sp. AG-I]
MNGYPGELIAQHVPLMFVAGLDAPAANVPPPPTPAKLATPVPSSRSRERMSIADLPTPSSHSDPFSVLIGRLRAALSPRKSVVWDSEPARRFHVILVDRNVSLPPRKIQLQPAQGAQPPLPARSPLSPLTPTSPLHPDGLIAPIWLRKHIELVPSVFVLFSRLWEGPGPKSPLEPRPEADAGEERQRDTELAMEIAGRKRSTVERGIKLTVVLLASRRALDDPSLDARLSFIRRQGGLDSRAALFVLSPVSSSELNEFVKSLQDALHESAMEYYVAHSKRVRRKRNRHNHGATPVLPHALGSGSGRPLSAQGWAVRYEYKMATFAEFRDEQEVARKHYEDCWTALVEMFGSTAVLPPRTKRWAEAKVLADCICKFYLYRAAPTRALAHFNRHLHRFADLSRGWGIGDETYEFWSWMARQHRIFAELLDHGLHNGLRIPSLAPPPLPHALPHSISASATLTPSTSDSSTTTSALKPTLSPSPSTPLAPGLTNPAVGQGINAALSSGQNPTLALQHPGFYYYIAAGCSQQRLNRFKAVLEAETSDPSPVSATPAFANEKKIDHHSLIVELFTKAYETFKSQQTGQSRLTYYIAYRIAETHYESGKFDLAVKFFERIAKTYRTERWTELLRPALTLWYDCARQLADIELSVKLLLEMLVPGMTSPEERENIGEDLMAILKSTAPTNGTAPITIDLSDHEPLFDISTTFWLHTSPVGQAVPFQIIIQGPKDGALSEVEFASIGVKFSGLERQVTVYHATDGFEGGSNVQRVKLDDISGAGGDRDERVGWLRWGKDGVLVLQGSLANFRAGAVKVESVTFHIREGDWRIELPFSLERKSPDAANAIQVFSWYNGTRFMPLRGSGSSVVSFVPPSHQVELSIEHTGSTYIGEHYPIEISVKNADEKPLHVSLDVLIQPSLDDSQNDITIDDETSSSLIKRVSIGLVPAGEFVSKTLLLFTRGLPGDRILDFSVRSTVLPSRAPTPSTRAPSPLRSPALQAADGLLSPASPTLDNKAFLPSSTEKDKTPAPDLDVDTTETLHTLTVPAMLPFTHTLRTAFERPKLSQPELLDPETFEEEYAEPRNVAVVDVSLGMEGPWDVEVLGIEFELSSGSPHVVLDDTLVGNADLFPLEWTKGDAFATTLRVQTHVDESAYDFVAATEELPLGDVQIKWKRVGAGKSVQAAISRITLPALKEPEDRLVALAHLPSFVTLHTPFPLHLTIENRTRNRTADIILSLETTETLVCAGPRTAHIPALLPGTSADVYLTVVALSPGFVRLPRIRIQDRRDEVPREAPSIAQGWDMRDSSGDLRIVSVRGEDGRIGRASVREDMYLLVKPS